MKNTPFSQQLRKELSLPATLIISFLLILLIDVVDYISDPLLDFSLFYLTPVLFSAWFRGRNMGIFMAGVAACSWLITEGIAGAIQEDFLVYYYWDSFTRLGFYVVVAMLLSSLKEKLVRQRELARTDSVTGSANARHFREIMELEIERFHRYEKPFAVIYFDLDHFKVVNDTLGHHVGDEVLVTVVNVTRKVLRASDLVARLGGDEFGVLMPETSEGRAERAMERLQMALLDAMKARDWPVTFSLGCISCVDDSPDAIELLQLVDQLMYRVKNSGKNGRQHMTYAEAKTALMPQGAA